MSSFALRQRLADRIYYGWVVVFACLLASLAVFGTTYSFGVFFDELLDSFDASRAEISAVFGIQTFVLYLGGVGAGRFVDERGQRLTAALSGVLLVGGVAATAVSRTFVELVFTFGIVTALGMAGLYVVAYATVPLWFERRRGMAAGIASAGLGVGLVTVPPLSEVLIGAVGWRNALFVLAGALALVCAAVAALFADRPSAVGADRGVEFGESDSRGPKPEGATPTITIREMLTPALALVFLGWTLLFAPMYVFFSHIVLHATEVGAGRSVGVLAITVVGITTTATRFVVGPVADRIGRTSVFVVCGAAMGVAIVGLALPPLQGSAAILATMGVFGIAYGGSGGLLAALTADLFGNDGLNTRYAVLSLAFAVAGLLAPPIAGYAFEQLGSYNLVFAAFGACGTLGSGFVWLASRRVARTPS
ncbi:MFS transporter [Haloferacaceae archaeon DSL9]